MNKIFFVILFFTIMIICIAGVTQAQFSFINPFAPPLFNPLFSPNPFTGLFGYMPRLPVKGPFLMPILLPGGSRTMLSPLRMPGPLLRHAAATVTIFFNPTLSVLQVTVLPISAPITAPATAVLPTTTVPTISPTSLLLLPLLGLTASTTPNTQVQVITVGSTAPVTPVTTPTTTVGLSSLLPFI